jgi:hypothetical protein
METYILVAPGAGRSSTTADANGAASENPAQRSLRGQGSGREWAGRANMWEDFGLISLSTRHCPS